YHQGRGLFRSNQRHRIARSGTREGQCPLSGNQLYIRLALSQLPIAGHRARAAAGQSRCRLLRLAVKLRARRLPGGCGGARRSGPRISGQHLPGESLMAAAVDGVRKPFVGELLGRGDFAIIGEIVEPGSKVLDLGCGEGELLQWLAENKGVEARGVEISATKVRRAIARGVSAYQGDIDEVLADYSDHAFDYLLLSQTLQATRWPLKVMRER